MKTQTVSLPYIDNAKAVLITLAINLGVVFFFFWPDGVTYSDVLFDSLVCAAITTIINMWFVYTRLKKMRAAGQMPAQVPVSPLMQKFPQNPFVLGAIYAIVFGVLIVGINGLILWFFGMQTMAFVPWVVYKLIYATVLSVKIVEFCIFRYVQPDFAKIGHGVDTETEEEYQGRPVKDPMPQISVFNEMFGSVTGNIAMNIIIGSVLGGVTVLADASVIIYPTTVEGIPITGLVFGLIVGILVTNGIVKEMNSVILASGPAMAEGLVADKRFTWIPVRRAALTCFICICVMIFSAVALPTVMTLFGISVMNFYQFTIFITVYATLISKPLSYVLIQRCIQPDYVNYILKKANVLNQNVG